MSVENLIIDFCELGNYFSFINCMNKDNPLLPVKIMYIFNCKRILLIDQEKTC